MKKKLEKSQVKSQAEKAIDRCITLEGELKELAEYSVDAWVRKRIKEILKTYFGK